MKQLFLLLLFVPVLGQTQSIKQSYTITWPDNSTSNVNLVEHQEIIELKTSDDITTTSTWTEVAVYYSLEGDEGLEFSAVKSDTKTGFDIVYERTGDTSFFVASDSNHYLTREGENREFTSLGYQAQLRVRKTSDTTLIAKLNIHEAWALICTHYVSSGSGFCLTSEHVQEVELGEIQVDRILGVQELEATILNGQLLIDSDEELMLIDMSGRIIQSGIRREISIQGFQSGIYFLRSNSGKTTRLFIP